MKVLKRYQILLSTIEYQESIVNFVVFFSIKGSVEKCYEQWNHMNIDKETNFLNKK